MMNQGIMMKLSLVVGLMMGETSAAAAGFPRIPAKRCAADAVIAGTVYLDAGEASVWRVPNPTTTNLILVNKIQLGRATRTGLTAGGATAGPLTVVGTFAPSPLGRLRRLSLRPLVTALVGRGPRYTQLLIARHR